MKDSYMGYRLGERLRMVHCADPYAPILPGTKGTIDYIDDMNTLHMSWDNGRTLGVCLDEDVVEKIPFEREYRSFHRTAAPECADEAAFDAHREKALWAIMRMDAHVLESRGGWVVRSAYLDAAHGKQPPEYRFVEAGELESLLDGADAKNGVDVGLHEAGGLSSFVLIAYGAEYESPSGPALVKEAFECRALTAKAAEDYRERLDAGWSDRGEAPRKMFLSPRDQQSLLSPLTECHNLLAERGNGKSKDAER